MERFEKSFLRQRPIPEAGIEAAARVMRSGRLHRYDPEGAGEASALEAEFAAWQGARFCLATASGGQAMQIALRACGARRVLTPAWTLAPVPGAIAVTGGEAVLVEVTDRLVIDLDDLAAKARAGDVLLLSLMRGHLPDMEALAALCAERGVTLIEDCAHSMGANFRGRRSGSFGLVGCFSTQSYKHMNSGEGGLLVSDDAGFMARAVVLSGSYMNYARHGAVPEGESFGDARLDMPNGSARMDELRAAVLRPQLAALDATCAEWVALCGAAEAAFRAEGLDVPEGAQGAVRVGSSIQFRADLPDPDGFLAACAARGVELKWFGAPEPRGFTSAHRSWRYVAPHDLPRTDAVLAGLYDMRLPLSFDADDVALIARIVGQEARRQDMKSAV